MHDRPIPQSIDHRCLEYHYTKLGRSRRYSTMHIIAWQIDYPPVKLSIDALNTATPNLADLGFIAQCTYMNGRPTPSQLSIDALHTTTPNLEDIAQCTYMHGRPTPPSQSSIDALHTTTPNLADIADTAQCTYIHGILTPPVKQA